MAFRWFNLTAAVLALIATAKGAGAVPVESKAEFFETKVRPILAARCGSCHGPNAQKGSLRTDSLTALLKGGVGGPALVPGNPRASRLILAISHTDPQLKMPPASKLAPGEIETLTSWVKDGAFWPKGERESASDKPLWSVQPIRSPRPPTVKDRRWVRNPIDAFVLRTLETRHMTPAPPANRRDLLRRVTFDVTGLPPTPKEMADFIADRSPNAYEKVVDRLLASPRYGERWARYWLDLVRYADTNGYERDGEKPYGWKYRDYVIRSLNEDKPYDRFVLEQLAGDELPDRSETTAGATGFLRLGTWDDEPNDALEYKYERLDDLVHASSTAFLGLTVRCARCHDHKFDPIPQKDYYAIAAAFYGGYLDPGDGKLMGGPPPDRLRYPVLGFTDRSTSAPPLHLLVNGDPRREAEAVEPGTLSMIPGLRLASEKPAPESDTTGRRLRLARWIVHPDNPLTARVMVNRLWQYHFGQGLVRTPNNFGRKGASPTHPELLDWLASTFKGPAAGWRLKPIHRLILLSSSYRMASVHPLQDTYNQKDAGNELLWRFNRRRLDADALRDSILAVSGALNLKEGGRGFVPTVTREALEGLSRKGAEWVPSPKEEQNRRTIYMFLKRALIMPLLTVFDFGDTTQPLEQRDVSLVAPQALALLNNPFLQEQSEAFARRIERECGKDRRRQVEQAFRLSMGRPPTPSEAAAALAHMRQTESLERLAQPPRVLAAPAPRPDLLLRADSGVETDAEGRVARWAGTMAASQPDAKARPNLARDSAGRPVIQFDGQGRFLTLDGQPVTSQQFTIVAVVSDRAGAAGHREILSNWRRADNIGTAVFLGLTTGANVRLTDHFAPAGTIQNPAEPFALTAVTGPGESRVFQNRVELSRIANGLPPRNLAGPYVIGQQGDINGEFWNGDMLELRVYNSALSTAELESIWDDLARRYGVARRPIRPDAALASLCHVLFNANEFVYID